MMEGIKHVYSITCKLYPLIAVCAVSDGMNQISPQGLGAGNSLVCRLMRGRWNVVLLELMSVNLSDSTRICHCLWSSEVLHWLICIVANCLTSLSFFPGFEWIRGYQSTYIHTYGKVCTGKSCGINIASLLWVQSNVLFMSASLVPWTRDICT